MFGLSKEALRDVAERAVRTFAQAFLATYGLDLAKVTNLDLAAQAATAGGAAVLAVVLGVIGVHFGSSKENASVR